MYKNHIKRGIDIIISACVLLVLWPVFLITAIAIKLESKGPVIFKQVRLGKDHKEFKMYKFRSMVVGAEHTGSGVYSSKGDSRVTKVGRIIRATSIDELPQAVNILKGDADQLKKIKGVIIDGNEMKTEFRECSTAEIRQILLNYPKNHKEYHPSTYLRLLMYHLALERVDNTCRHFEKDAKRRL